MALIKTSFAWTDLCIYLKYYMRNNILQNCSWDFLHKKSYFLQVGKPIPLKVKCFVRKELKVRSNQYFLFHLMGISTIQLWDLLYELLFSRVYSGTGLSEHRVDHWIWNMNKEETLLFLHSALPKFMNLLLLFWILLRSSWISWESAKH